MVNHRVVNLKLYPKLEHASDNAGTLERLVKPAKETCHSIDEQVLLKLLTSWGSLFLLVMD